MIRTITWITIAAALALGACNKKSENPPSTGMTGGSGSAGAAGGGPAMAGSGSAMAAGSGSAAAAAGSGSATAAGSASGSAAVAQVDVPTEVDFEEDATTKITDKNVEAQVQAIEKELEQK